MSEFSDFNSYYHYLNSEVWRTNPHKRIQHSIRCPICNKEIQEFGVDEDGVFEMFEYELCDHVICLDLNSNFLYADWVKLVGVSKLNMEKVKLNSKKTFLDCLNVIVYSCEVDDRQNYLN